MTNELPKLSVRLHGGLTPQQCVAQARAAEAAGFTGLWFAENPFARGILPAAAACAAATRTLTIGAGVFNPYNRHPTLIVPLLGPLGVGSFNPLRVVQPSSDGQGGLSSATKPNKPRARFGVWGEYRRV
jgi:hypothetical protein